MQYHHYCLTSLLFTPYYLPMEPRIQELAIVQMGLVFRERLEPAQGGNVPVIQMRNLTEDNRLDVRNLLRIQLDDVSEHHFVQHKDLIFRSRGKTNTAVIIDIEPGRAIVAAPLLRIRVTSEKVLPEYLCWFINQPPAQAFLYSRATGTAMVTIGKSVLEDLEVSLPDIEAQKKIAEVAALSDKEQRLMRDLAKERKRWVDGVLMQLARESGTNLNQRR